MTDAPEQSVAVEGPPVISRRGKRWITHAVLLACLGMVGGLIWSGDGANLLHQAALGSAFWTIWGILGSLGIAELVPLLPALWRPAAR